MLGIIYKNCVSLALYAWELGFRKEGLSLSCSFALHAWDMERRPGFLVFGSYARTTEEKMGGVRWRLFRWGQFRRCHWFCRLVAIREQGRRQQIFSEGYSIFFFFFFSNFLQCCIIHMQYCKISQTFAISQKYGQFYHFAACTCMTHCRGNFEILRIRGAFSWSYGQNLI